MSAIVSGIVDKEGQPVSGAGFRVVKDTTRAGTYTVLFSSSPFTSPPGICVTVKQEVNEDSRITGASLTEIGTESFQVVTGSVIGLPEDRAFSFVAAES